jgi:hypothetical protein
MGIDSLWFGHHCVSRALESCDIEICLQQMAGVAVAKSVDAGAFGDTRFGHRFLDGPLNMGFV